MVFRGLHGRKDLHQLETCSEIVHLWCSVVVLISESPGWDMTLDFIILLPETVVAVSLTISILDTLAGLHHTPEEVSPNLTAAATACKSLRAVNV